MNHPKKCHITKRTGWFSVCTGLCLFISACSLFKYAPPAVTPPSIVDARYVGPKTCSTSDCHQTQQQYFKLNIHSSVAIPVTKEDVKAGHAEACETCHGPGSLHVKNRGRKYGDILMGDSEACFSCHPEIKAKFNLQHHHPVPEGRMGCPDCHSMHGKDVTATGGAMLTQQNEMCFNCHKDKKGPFVFKHDAIRDGCQSCHDPHGSINDKLLAAGQRITCLRCHWESGFNTSSGSIGGSNHNHRNIGTGQDCVDCHTAVHGSNVWRSLRK